MKVDNLFNCCISKIKHTCHHRPHCYSSNIGIGLEFSKHYISTHYVFDYYVIIIIIQYVVVSNSLLFFRSCSGGCPWKPDVPVVPVARLMIAHLNGNTIFVFYMKKDALVLFLLRSLLEFVVVCGLLLAMMLYTPHPTRGSHFARILVYVAHLV